MLVTKLSLRLVALSLLGLAPVVNSSAAVITWGAAQGVNYNTATQVSTNGTYVDSFTYSSTNVSVNGVTFDAFTGTSGTVASFAGGGITVNLGTNTSFQQFAASNGNADPTYNSYGALVAKTGLVLAPVAAQVSLVNLTSGYTYEVQLWQAPWDNTNPMNFSSSSNFTTGVSGNVGSTGGVVVNGKQVPQFIVGTFVADSTTQSIYYQPVNTAGFATGPAAGQLRVLAVPEPATWALVTGALTFVLIGRRQRV